MHLTYEFNTHFVCKNEGMNLTLAMSDGFNFQMMFKSIERSYCSNTLDLA